MLTCPTCGEPCAVAIAYDEREGCAACWLSGRASAPGHDDGGAGPLSSAAAELHLQRRVWNKGSARTSGPAQASGAVRVHGSRLIQCPKCGGSRLVGWGARPWGPHAARANDRGELVDCVGDLLAPAVGQLLEATG